MELNLAKSSQVALEVFMMFRHSLIKTIYDGSNGSWDENCSKMVKRAVELAQGDWSKVRVYDVTREIGRHGPMELRQVEVRVRHHEITAVFRILVHRTNIYTGNKDTNFSEWTPWKVGRVEVRAQPCGKNSSGSVEKIKLDLYPALESEFLQANLMAPMKPNPVALVAD